MLILEFARTTTPVRRAAVYPTIVRYPRVVPFFDTMVSPPGTARRFEPRPMSCPGSRFAAERVRR